MQLKRSTLEQWVTQPFFADAIKGCVVRLVNGTTVDAMGQQVPNTLMMRVVGLVEKRPYK
jgi:hypothetical protein